jgi:hypothetical protein
MIADIAAQHFDGALQPDCRELAQTTHCTAAYFASGIILIMNLAISRSHDFARCGDELAYLLK